MRGLEFPPEILFDEILHQFCESVRSAVRDYLNHNQGAEYENMLLDRVLRTSIYRVAY